MVPVWRRVRGWPGGAGARILVGWILLCGAALASAGGSAEGTVIDVRTDPEGGVRAHAVLQLSASVGAVQQVLTDYANWPRLFETKMRVTKVERMEDRTVTEVYIAHPIMPGERRLLGENRTLPGGGLSTKLIGGDFRRYERTWHLSADRNGRTHAEFDLLVEVETLAPDWLVAMEVKRELDAHFKILQATLAAGPAR